MVDIIIAGESGKLHAVYHKAAAPAAPQPSASADQAPAGASAAPGAAPNPAGE